MTDLKYSPDGTITPVPEISNPHGKSPAVLPSVEEIEAARTPAGGWTRAQLAQWGVPWPPPKGWKQRLIELATIDQEQHY